MPSTEEAAQLATNLNGGSWTSQVLDSGKVDEQRFLAAIGNFFRVPVVSIDPKKIDRETLSILPSRFVFQHHILPIEVKENSVVLATYDLFNSIGRQLAVAAFEKTGRMGAGAARADLARDENALRRRRGNIRRDSKDEPLLRSAAGWGHRHRAERGRSGSVGGEIREPDHSRGDRRARDRYSRRTAGKRFAHSLPDRRNFA